VLLLLTSYRTTTIASSQIHVAMNLKFGPRENSRPERKNSKSNTWSDSGTTTEKNSFNNCTIILLLFIRFVEMVFIIIDTEYTSDNSDVDAVAEIKPKTQRLHLYLEVTESADELGLELVTTVLKEAFKPHTPEDGLHSGHGRPLRMLRVDRSLCRGSSTSC